MDKICKKTGNFPTFAFPREALQPTLPTAGDFDGTELSLDAFNAPCEKARTPIPLLYQSGYLTIQSYDRKLDTFTLHFPNHEVRQGMIRSMTSYLMDADNLECDTTIVSMTRALLNGDLSTALTALRSYIAGLPYDIITKKKPKDFQLALPSWRQHPHSPSPSRAPLPCDRAGGKIHSAA